MNDLSRRIGAPQSQPPRTKTQEAPPRLRALLREVLIEQDGMLAAYRKLADAAGQATEDIWSAEWAEPRVRELSDNLPWDVVYDILEESAPSAFAGRDTYEKKVNDVLAKEGIAYEMVNAKTVPFDPERDDFELQDDNPVDDADPRFAPVRRQYQRALDALNGHPEDTRGAIRESLNALEALGRILTDKPKASLAETVDKLLGNEPHRRALGAAIKALYGYSSTVPGARHGEHKTVDIEFPEAAFAVRSAGAAIAMFIAEERKKSGE